MPLALARINEEDLVNMESLMKDEELPTDVDQSFGSVVQREGTGGLGLSDTFGSLSIN